MVSGSSSTINGLKVDEANGLCDTAERQSLTPDDNWYLIQHGWWMNFMELKENPGADGLVRMPPIDNDSLVTKEADGSYELKPKLVDSLDYVLVPEEVFTALKRAYGVVDDERDVIVRKVVENVLADHALIVEIYPLIVKVANFKDMEHVVPLKISKGESMDRICGRAMDMLNIPEAERTSVRFIIDDDGKYTEFLPSKMTQAAVNMLLSEDAVVYLNTGESASSSGTSSSSMVTRRSTTSTSETSTGQMRRGLCGLQNMGNTCFMNSALQCLSNVPELTEFFLSDTYLREINEQNPLGAQGRLAKAYGCLIKDMWSGSAYSVKPSKLKSVIGEVAPRFNGYSQQDSQELTSFLLDGLHEDLNRIRDKPYTPESEDDDSIPHEHRAQRSWQTYKKRNDSVIVDLFHGQLKSTLVCPVCEKVSVKFDPFCFLSVPVPAKERNTISVINLVRSEKWAKFAINHSTKAVASQATAVIKENLKLPEATRIVLMTTFSTDILQPDDRLSGMYATTKSFYAFIVDEGPLIVVENKASMQDRILGVPLVLNMTGDGKSISRRIIYDDIVPLVRERLWKKYSDVEMREDTENISPAKSTTDSQLPLPSEAIFYCDKKYINLPNQLNDEVVQLPQDNAGDFKVCLKWKTVDMFQPVDLSRLVEREVNMTTTMKKCYSLDECLDMFTSQEQLDQNDSWYCPGCKAHQRAYKKLDLWKLPRILIVHLKRFQYSRYNRDKIETDIVIPTRNFDLAKKLLGPGDKTPKYDLIAISNHMGGLGSGHYTALALNGDTWVEFNDSTAAPTRNTRSSMAETMTTREGYILYYRRQDCFPTDLGGSTKKAGLDVKASTKSSPANRKMMNGSFGSPTTRSAARNLNLSFNNGGSSNGNSATNSDSIEDVDNGQTAMANGRDTSAKRRLSESTKMDVDEQHHLMSFFYFELATAACGAALSARRLKLLDDEDVPLVDKSPTNKCWQLIVRPLIHVLFVLFCFGYPFRIVISSVLLIFHIFPLNCFVMPYIILRLGYVPFDSNFQRFLSTLKRQNMCLFSTDYFTKDNLLLRSTRIRYLTEMRKKIALFQKASEKIAGEEGEKTENALLIKFINDEMRELIAVDGPMDDDHLSVKALHNCWQYLFLVRSEFLRLSILAQYPTTPRAFSDCTQYRTAFTTMVTLMRTFSFGAIYKEKASSARPAADRHSNYGAAAALTPHESVTYQLEWILQSLHDTGSIPKGEDAQKIVRSLRNIISTIESESQNEIIVNTSATETTPNDDDDERDDASLDLTPPERESANDDLQIFEMYTGNDDTINDDLAAWTSSAMDDTETPAQMDTRPFLLELKNVISRRKDVVIEREIVALAKLRGVPVEQIPREELDRAIFAEPTMIAENVDDVDTSQLADDPPPEVSSGSFGRMVNFAEFDKIMAQCHRIMGSVAIEEVLEDDGDSSDENVVIPTDDGNDGLLADDDFIEFN